MLGRYRSLSRYVEITSSTNRISYDKNLLLTCRNLGTLLYLIKEINSNSNKVLKLAGRRELRYIWIWYIFERHIRIWIIFWWMKLSPIMVNMDADLLTFIYHLILIFLQAKVLTQIFYSFLSILICFIKKKCKIKFIFCFVNTLVKLLQLPSL